VDLPARIETVEVGSRDGLQNEKINVPTPEKIALDAKETPDRDGDL
jgi:hypothetical protein